MSDDDNDANEADKNKRIAEARKKHPNGFCLLARDNDHNRKIFPHGPFGKIQTEH